MFSFVYTFYSIMQIDILRVCVRSTLVLCAGLDALHRRDVWIAWVDSWKSWIADRCG